MFCRKNELDERRKTKKEVLLMVEMILTMKSCSWSWDDVFDEFDVEREMMFDGVFVEKNGCWLIWCRKDEKSSCAACAMKWSEVKVKRKRMCECAVWSGRMSSEDENCCFLWAKGSEKAKTTHCFVFGKICAKRVRLDEWHAEKVVQWSWESQSR
jgi:hypothetical protein